MLSLRVCNGGFDLKEAKRFLNMKYKSLPNQHRMYYILCK